MFTEIMSKTEWLKLMDYLFTFVWRQSTFLLAPVAILRTIRASILCVTSGVHLHKFFRSQQAIYASDVIKLILTMEEQTPPKLFSAVIGTSGNSQRDGLDQKRDIPDEFKSMSGKKGGQKQKARDALHGWDEEEELENMDIEEFDR